MWSLMQKNKWILEIIFKLSGPLVLVWFAKGGEGKVKGEGYHLLPLEEVLSST